MKRFFAVLLTVFLLASLLVMPVSAANEDLHISDAGLEMIMDYEGFRSMAYEDGGKWYIGYGTGCGQYDYPYGITQEQARAMLLAKVASYETKVKNFLNQSGIQVTQSQFDALMSLTYNNGGGWMTTEYSLGRYVLYGGYETDLEFVNSIGCWCHNYAGNLLAGLADRRRREAKMYLYGSYDGENCPDYVYINFGKNGGTMESDVRFYTKGLPYEEFPTAEREGLYFVGWADANGELLTGDMIAMEDIRVTAVWSETPPVQAPTDDPADVITPAEPEENQPSAPVTPVTPVTPVIRTYSDVKANDWFYTDLMTLSSLAVVDGYPDGTFRPENPATCGETLKLIIVNAGYGEQPTLGSHWADGYLYLAIRQGWVDAGVIQNLDAPVSRLLVAQIAAKALGLDKLYTGSPYADCDDGYVLAMYRVGLMKGSEDLTGTLVFCPNQGIKRNELCTLINRMRNVDLHSDEIKYADQWYKLDPEVARNPYDLDSFVKDSSGYMHYTDASVETVMGIDVSSHQGKKIDWEKVAKSGVEFVMIRAGYRGYTQGSLYLDEYFKTNLEGAKAAGLKVGVYFYSQAITVAEAAEEADFVVQALAGVQLDYPVVYDWEVVGTEEARTDHMDGATLTACALAFCQRIQWAGYTPMIYMGKNVAYPLYDMSEIDQYDFWLASYSDHPDFAYNFHIWQYTATGSVPGIKGNVDLNIAMKRYA